MSRRESNGFLKSIAKDLAEGVLYWGKLLALAIPGFLVLVGVLIAMFHLKLGIFGVYAAATAFIVLMGWVVYGTDQESRDSWSRDSWSRDRWGRDSLLHKIRSYAVGLYLDTVDMVLIGAFWVVFIFATLEDDSGAYSVLIFPFTLAVLWFRRRFFPSTVVRFQSKNIFLRTTSVFCIIHSAITVVFGMVADAIASPAHYARIFYLIAGFLVLLAVSIHRIECRQNTAETESLSADRDSPRRR